jgi:uncharacterized protein (TIGR00730 family)
MSEKIKETVAVFCGSKAGNDPGFMESAAILGRLLAINGFDIVYGGSGKGLMGAIANNAMENGAFVTGVIPEVLLAWEQQHTGISNLIVSTDMHDRKKTIFQMGFAGIVLPGGFGTLDELFEMLTWNQLSIHDKKIFILNTNGFYDHLIAHFEMMSRKGFLYDAPSDRISVHANPESLVEELVRG